MKRFYSQALLFIAILAAAVVVIFVLQYLALPGRVLLPGESRLALEGSTASVPYVVEEFVSELEVPWSIVWTSPERMLVAERPGRLRVVESGVLRKDPLLVFADISSKGEEGLMGLAVDPHYKETHALFACYAYPKGEKLVDRVVKIEDLGTSARVSQVLIDDIPAAAFHAGCRVAVGPDGKLYITTGDATDKTVAQERDSLAGKILRINTDGSIPSDNPFPGSLVWSYGHRNAQGLAWHPLTDELYVSEHGPSIFDGPAGGDEINHIMRGGNYGWPLVSHKEHKEGTIAPILLFTPAEAPASAAFYSGNAIPQFTNNLFFGALIGEGLVRVVLDPQNLDMVSGYEKLSEVSFGRIRAVAEGPDGFLYFSTSNRDGRGEPAQSDDRIFRIRPQ